MGGSGGSSGKLNRSEPPQARPIDYRKLMAQAGETAKEQYRDQLAAQIEAYPQMERLQLGTVSKISDNLGGDNNTYTRRALDQLIAAEDQATQIGRIGDYTEQLGYQAARDLEGTDIERELGAQALRELQLGRSLTPEQERMAQQAARAGMSSRGLGVGNAALAAEVLNRDAYASAREAERRNFAGTTNQMLVGNRQNRIGQVGNILGQSANTRMNQANLRSSLAGANVTIDPYARAMNPALGMGATTLGNSGQMIGSTWQGANQMAGNVASFNANMQQSDRNTYLTNQAALEAARLTSGATQNAGWMAMLGGAMQGAGSAASALSDRRMKKDIKPLGKAGSILGLTAYEYEYKDGDGQKHVGFMAQDVQKVLPEAVEEKNYKGKTRLAIKPAVIGQAFAQALTP